MTATKPPDELPIEKLRRMVANLNYEPEWLLQQLPSIAALEEYFDLWAVYDTEYLAGIEEAVEEGADPAPYNAFVRKHKLTWRKFRASRKEPS